MNILFKLRNLYKTGHNRVLPVHEIFTRGDDFFEQNGVVVPENVLRKLKDAVRRRDHNEIYVSRCVKNAMPEGFESTEEHQKMLSIAKSFYSDIDEIETPFRLDCGIFLTWAGGAMIVLSDGVLAPAGKWVAGLGIAMTLEGLIEYKERYDQFVQERDQREKLKIQEEARKAEKDARKKAEKA